MIKNAYIFLFWPFDKFLVKISQQSQLQERALLVSRLDT